MSDTTLITVFCVEQVFIGASEYHGTAFISRVKADDIAESFNEEHSSGKLHEYSGEVISGNRVLVQLSERIEKVFQLDPETDNVYLAIRGLQKLDPKEHEMVLKLIRDEHDLNAHRDPPKYFTEDEITHIFRQIHVDREARQETEDTKSDAQ